MYDPFCWYERELDRDYEEENMGNTIEIDLDAITQRMDELKDAKARYTFELKQVEKEIEKEELKLIALLDQTGVESMDFGCYSFGWKTTVRNSLDQKYLKEHYEDVFNACYMQKENRTFQFKINK